jgi:UDP-N-acetylglucosamine 2-epimerase
MKVLTVLGTRPEIIKLSALMQILDQKTKHVIVHTGQHYSSNMDKQFFEELNLRNSDYHLSVGSGSQADQTAKILTKIEKIMSDENPDVVLVLGDTNSTLAGALAARKLGLMIAHIESGCRSRNKNQPEEVNRIVSDHCSDLLFVFDEESRHNLLKEGFSDDQIFNTGNIVYDACRRALLETGEKNYLWKMGLEPNKFILVTIHRAENTDDVKRLRKIVEALNKLSETITVVFPIHPRTKKAIDDRGLILSPKIKQIDPSAYVPFVNLLSKALLVITDSGGVQQESVFLNVPVIIPRDKIEMNEFLDAGKCFISSVEDLYKFVNNFVSKPEQIEKVRANPLTFEENTSQKIFDILAQKINTQVNF